MRMARSLTMLGWLTFRRQLWSWGSLMVGIPFVLTLMFLSQRRYDRIVDEAARFDAFSNEFVIVLFAGFLVPLCALAFGTTSLGNERDDGTLVFLLTRPISRPWIVLVKFFATLPLALGWTISFFGICCAAAGGAGWLAWERYLPAVVLLGLAYTAVFHLFATLFQHPTIAALIYAFFFEFLMGNLPGIIKHAAISYYGRSIMIGLGLSEGLTIPPSEWIEPISVDLAMRTLLWVTGLAVGAAMVVFTTRDF